MVSLLPVEVNVLKLTTVAILRPYASFQALHLWAYNRQRFCWCKMSNQGIIRPTHNYSPGISGNKRKS